MSTRFVDAAMTASYGVTVGFMMYLCLKITVPETLVARVSFTHKFQHRLCSQDVPITYSFLQCYAIFCAMSVFFN